MEPLEFWTICNRNGILLSHEQVDRFDRFHKELVYWNEKINLISRKDMDNIWEHHFLHSLSIVKADIIPAKAICMDIGTGGGFPGIPVGIAREDCKVTLVDSIAKKMKLTSMFAAHTGLRGLTAITTRMEDLSTDKQFKGKYDIIMARAVAPIEKLVNWTLPLLKPNGSYILLKGGDLTQEILQAKESIKGIHIQELPIIWKGIDWFTTEDKKIIVCTFPDHK